MNLCHIKRSGLQREIMKNIILLSLIFTTSLLTQGCLKSVEINKQDMKATENISKESALDYLNSLKRPKGDMSCVSFDDEGVLSKKWDNSLAYSEAKVSSVYIYEQYRVAMKWKKQNEFCDLHWTKDLDEAKRTILSLKVLGVQLEEDK